ncbi:MAG TPA: ABC transporter substrate-binding protein [Chloroflexota bacterium]|nr:ABC transporter substrate-binding protein [Chloroflexota bacterium]
MKTTRIRLLVASLAALVAAAACGGTAPAPTTSSAAAKPSAAASASAKPAASSAASAPASAAAKPSVAAAAGPIKIGYILPLTGIQANIAKDNQDGFNLYLESISSTMAGRKLEVSFADDKLQPDVGLTKAKELVESSKVNILMGISSTTVAYPVAQYVKDAHIPLLLCTNSGSQGLTMDSRFASPYLVRITQNGAGTNGVTADWLLKQGKKKVVMLTTDFAAGIENADLFGSAYVYRGGTIVQEIHPAPGTTDFGPFIAQLSQDADAIYEFSTGVDGLRLLEQYYTAASKKMTFLDLYAATVAGPNLSVLKDKAVGVVAVSPFSEAYDSPGVQNFLKAWKAKYPDRLVSQDAAAGYAGAQVLEAALKKVNGNIGDTQPFLEALYETNMDTGRGPLKLDKFHDVVQDMKVFSIEKQGNSYGQKMIETYKDVGQFWDRTEDQLRKFEFGKMKGKWVGMTKDKLGDVITLPKS